MNTRLVANSILVVLLLALLVGSALVELLAEFLWLEEVGYSTVLWTQLKTQVAVGGATGAAIFLLLWINLKIARRARGFQVVLTPTESDVLSTPQIQELRPLVNRLLPLGLGVVSLLAGIVAAAYWDQVLCFLEPTAFGRTDPLFGNDIGFYVFQLPLLKSVYVLALLGLALSLVVAAGSYLLNGQVVVTEQRTTVAPQVRPHLFTLAGLMILGRAAGYVFDRYELLYSPRGITHGACYTDVHVLLPVLTVLLVLAALSGALVIACGFRPAWKPAAAMVVLWIFVSFAGSDALPVLVQKLKVTPNQFSLEKPFIEHGIRSTRAAYDVESVEEKSFSAEENLTTEALRQNDLTVQNIRLWDHRPLLTAYEQLQEIRTYYDFSGVDVDRYTIDGKYRQVMLSAREISSERLPSRLWVNERLSYTHGHGAVVSPVNRILGDGLPDFLVKDIPPNAHPDLKITRPEIYFGERSNDYVFVNTAANEFDYPAGDSNVYTTYKGTGGVRLGGFGRRLLFAAYFKSASILLSSDLTATSRILYRRRIDERLRGIAPFLTFDRDPYLVISKGRLYWLCDAYTLTGRYPYSQPVPGVGNYLRNSVKAVVDAYNGAVKLYVADDKDPIIRTYRRIFPALFEPLTAMDPDLLAHIRVPQLLFDVQARIYATYHMTDPQVFFNREDVWEIPAGDEKPAEAVPPMTSPRSPDRRPVPASPMPAQTMEPYYTIMKLPDASREEFIQLIPFTPARKDNLRAWMCVRNDPPHYGKLLVYSFPKAKTVYGPSQINARIEQESEISKQLTLWKQGGSSVIRGNLLIIPIDQSLLYVQSLYLKAAQGEIPELKRVIAAFGHRIVMETSLDRSLRALFGESAGAAPAPSGPRPPPSPGDAGDQSTTRAQQELARQALNHLRQARQSYRRDAWAGFGLELNRLEEALTRLGQPRKALGGHAPAGSIPGSLSTSAGTSPR